VFIRSVVSVVLKVYQE